ncbi:AIR synthase family protein [Tissierella carlieri]|uniref:AIR synthase family protein n=1 Tax=Tissierella carlieri TaxID=689904 RepID=A0ABT1SGU3_9FIRM|nr:AIR synthase family protein [Tissierella carlieri]MCQ4925713.1 AIR synthase family protein [Tissierella carlieri]
MEIGKLPNDVLEKIVLSNIKNKREEVLVRAAVGEDNAIIDFGNNLCVMSTDPITGATKDIGRLAVHISCNDVSTSGAEPMAVLMTILAPPNTTEKDIENIMREAGEVAKEINVEIVGGHTEITDAVNRIVISTTVIGKQSKEKLPNSKEIKVGDKVLITKYVGIEGTSIIAKELEEQLIDKIGKNKLDVAQNMDSMLSVVKEGIICGEIGVRYMHDITEGGVFGAVWEASKATGKGIEVLEESIPIKDVTREITDIIGIDPYRLISSGSMLIIAEDEKVSTINEELNKVGIKVTAIGKIIEEGIILNKNGEISSIEPPEADELYKALSLHK